MTSISYYIQELSSYEVTKWVCLSWHYFLSISAFLRWQCINNVYIFCLAWFYMCKTIRLFTQTCCVLYCRVSVTLSPQKIHSYTMFLYNEIAPNKEGIRKITV